MKTFTEWLESTDGPHGYLNLCKDSDASIDAAVMAWARECYVPDDDVANFATAVASGDQLDKLADMIGLERAPHEDDAGFRARIEKAKL